MHKPDEELVREARAGDREAFDQLVTRYMPGFSALAYDRLGNGQDVQDAVQEALVMAYRKLPQLREPSRFASWVYGILRNQCALRLRSRGAERRATERMAEARAGTGPLTPLESLEADERSQRIRKAVEGLSPVLREMVVLRFLGGAGRQEAARILDIGLDAADKRLERALRELRQRLDGMNKPGGIG